MRTRLAVCLVAVVLVSAACAPAESASPDTASPSVAPSDVAPSQAAASQAAGESRQPPGPAASMLPPDVAMAPTSADKIQDDVAAGTLDEATGILYRVYAAFGDSRLPQTYASDTWTEDNAALALAIDQFDTLPADIAAELKPFLVRPTDPSSVFFSSRTGSRVTLASTRSATAAVVCNGNWGYIDGVKPFRIWGSCGGTSFDTEIVTVAAMMEDLWDRESTFMGREPIKDLPAPDMGGSDRIDIYLVGTCVTRGGSCRPVGRFGITVPSAAFEGTARPLASSSFMVVNHALVGEGIMKSTLAHEFFHVLQNAYNYQGLVSGGFFWFYEASATWAEWKFVPEGVTWDSGPHQRYFSFQSSPYSLQKIIANNAYWSWAWPLFMQQEKGEASIADAWKAIKGKSGERALSEAVNAQLSFDARFHDFAVRDYNQVLAGDPIPKLFPAQAVGDPRDEPMDPRMKDPVTLPANPPGTEPLKIPAIIPPLYAEYHPFKVDDDVGQIKLDFRGLHPEPNLDVDALLKIKGKDWKLKHLTNGETRFCSSVEDEDIEEMVIILSNHDWGPGAAIAGNWRVESLLEPCDGFRVKLTWTDVFDGIEDTVVFEGIIDTIEPSLGPDSVYMTGRGTATGSRPGWTHCNPGIDVVPSGTAPATLGGTIIGDTITIAAFAEEGLAGVTTDDFEVPLEGGRYSISHPIPVGELCPRTSRGVIEMTPLSPP
jgi:hypothetical protein